MNEEDISDYRMAGELFGLILEEITFGQLSMSREARTFKYQWRFSVTNERYGTTWGISIHTFRLSRLPLNNMALEITCRWKRFYQAVLEKDHS